MPGVRIMTYGYNSDVFLSRDTLPMADNGLTMLDQLAIKRAKDPVSSSLFFFTGV